MCETDASSVFVVFITSEYIRKCAYCGAEDNCHAEFSYAVQRKGVQKVVAVVMEPRAERHNEVARTDRLAPQRVSE